MTERNPILDRLAQGYRCPRCGVTTDETCRSATGLPHAARIDRAVAAHKASNAPALANASAILAGLR